MGPQDVTILVGFGKQVAMTPSYPGTCPLPLFVALCDHNSPTLQTDRQPDERHARSISVTSIIACDAINQAVVDIKLAPGGTSLSIYATFRSPIGLLGRCEKSMASSTKPEVHNVYCIVRIEPRPQAT